MHLSVLCNYWPQGPDAHVIALHPGLGKTTLAHVVARHCGYRPLEINASDDRTATTLVTRITDAVQMRAVMGSGRPNCVIIDEIDGAAGTRMPTRSVLAPALCTLCSGSALSNLTRHDGPSGRLAFCTNRRLPHKHCEFRWG